MTATKAAPKPSSIFDLSSGGRLSALLRMIADQIDAGQVTADSFTWQLTQERLDFSARIDLKPHE